MTSFNVQSTFLDLKKHYQGFQYQHLVNQGIVEDELNVPQEDIYSGMTQNTYLFVQEKNVLTKDIENLSIYFAHKFTKTNPNVKQKAFQSFPFQKIKDRVCFIFQKYQEQPTLLDTLLQALILPIMNAIKDYLALILKKNEKCVQQMHALLMIIYQLTKVRGKKWVMQFFPHQVKDLYPAIGYLARQVEDQSTNWQTRYVILLWLGVIVLVPFDLDIIDSGVITLQQQNGKETSEIVQLLIEIGKKYLKSITKMRDASALFLGKLFTRHDIQKRDCLTSYVKYALQKINQFQNNPMETFFVCGLYLSLAQIFKRVQRSQLLLLIKPVLQQLQAEKKQTTDNPLKKQYKMKLIKRMGLCYLKPRIATWAYRKKKQSLLSNLTKSTKNQIKTNTQQMNKKMNQESTQHAQGQDNQYEYYRDVNKVSLQLIVDHLIQGLSEKQTLVRQAASKGLGLISGRLSQDMVLDILDYILDLTPNPRTQHAICLTIAELARRNLLSPQKIQQLYPFMQESLLYEKQQGGYSVGQAVRDAACYMAWSVARGYEQGGKQLGVSLMIAACFDRQVGCRRAASAAYQQLVGRVGDVPHGIQILTEADYFTLGMQKNAFLNVAVFVASYQQYFKPFVEHLAFQKIRHWDLQMKRIGACSLSLMCPLNPQFIAKQLLPSLKNYLQNDSMNIKLGTIIGIGQILLGLSGLSHIHQLHNQMKDSVFLKSLTQNEKKLMKAGQYMQQFKAKYDSIKNINYFHLIESETLKNISQSLCSKIKDGKLFKGKAGQNFRIYTCRLLECFAICKVPLESSQILIYLDFIEQQIKNPLEKILHAAVKCLKPFLQTYYSTQRDQKYIKNFIEASKPSLPISKGYTLALSKLSRDIYLNHSKELIQVLQHSCRITKDNDDPQKRKCAILAIQALVREIGFKSQALKNEDISRIFSILFKTTNDYTMDKRGDIGSIVRQASMSSLIDIIEKYCSQTDKKWIISNQDVEKMIGLFLQQLSQKIDRVRLLSGSLLQRFFDYFHQHFQISDQQQIAMTFKQENIKKLIKQNEDKIDKNLETQVIEMQMKIQETIFHETDRYLIYFWNLPHSVYPVVVPLLALSAYSFYILKGICTSTGGISQSIIKYSLQELGQYITKIAHNQQNLLERLFRETLQILVSHYRDDRIIVPMYKTLDYILQREQVIKWPGIHKFDGQLFKQIQRQTLKTKSIVKVSASTGLYVSLLSLNNPETKSKILANIVRILCSDLPKARKVLSDKLLLFLMSQQQYEIFSEEQTEQLMNILSEYDFLDEKLPIDQLKNSIQTLLNIKIQ